MKTEKAIFNFDFSVPNIVFPSNIISEVLGDALLFEEIKNIDNKKITDYIHKKLSNKFPKIKNFKFELINVGSDYLETLYNIFNFKVNVIEKA